MNKKGHILYWVEQADDSWKSAGVLMENKRYMMALFCWHLTIEKLLKAMWVKNNKDNYPPRTHNLTFLHDSSNAALTEDMQAELNVINSWNIEGRYPDYQNKLYKSITKKYLESKRETVEKTKRCLLEKLR